MDPQPNTTQSIKTMTPEQKLEILTKVKKYANQNYEKIITNEEVSEAEKKLDGLTNNL